MDRINRRRVVQGVAAVAGAMTLGAPSVHAQSRSTLRFVAQADLQILDPVWTSGYITRNHSYLVYDTLFGTGRQLASQTANGRSHQRVSRLSNWPKR